MTYVVDTNVVLRLVLEEGPYKEVRDWFGQRVNEGEHFLAPDILFYEAASIVENEYHDIEPDDRADVLEVATRFVALREPPVQAMFDIAHQQDVGLWDAAFIALAQERDVALVSGDGAMLAAARSIGVETREIG